MAEEKLLQRELGRMLEAWRIRDGLTKEEAVWRLGTSKDILNSYESGRLQFMEPAIVVEWLRQYGAPESVVEDARAKAKRIRQGSPSSWQASAPHGFNRFTELEPMAATIDSYEDGFVSGLLQTAGYAELVMGINPNLSPEERRNAVGFRMARPAKVLDRPGGPPQARFVQAEESLNRVRGTDLYEDLVNHLVKINGTEGVEILIVPAGQTHPSMGRSYVIMSFPDNADPDVVYQENLTGGYYEADKAEVARCRNFFESTLPFTVTLDEWRASDVDQ